MGIVGIIVLIALRIYSGRKLEDELRRSRQPGEEEVSSYAFRINVIRVASVLFVYLELVTAIILVAKNLSYGLSASSTYVVLFGIVLHIGCNMAFLVGYCCIISKKRIAN